MNYITKKDIKLVKRKKDSHKGENGKVLVVGGSLEYMGAVLLAGIASLRTGVDSVVVAAPEKTAVMINSFAPDMITIKFSGDYFNEDQADEIIKISKNFDVLLIGNGLGLLPTTQKFAKKVIEQSDCMKVIDADAVKIVNLKKTQNAILTPHQKELELLLNNNGLSEIANTKDFTKKMNKLKTIAGSNVFLVKGRVDAIVSKNNIAFNRTGNEGMTVGGTGDVLAGITSGLLSQEKDLFKAAIYAAFINGEIGDILKKDMGYGFMASDMINKIPEVMMRYRK